MINVAINGFGRIGRAFFRAIIQDDVDASINVVAVNDIASKDILLYLMRYDSVHDVLEQQFNDFQRQSFYEQIEKIKFLSVKTPEQIDWGEMDVDIVIESTGKFKTHKQLSSHIIKGGAKKVVVSTIVEDADVMVVYGLNHHDIKTEHEIISGASCTSNCLLNVISALKQKIDIVSAHMTSIHSYTNDQSLVDAAHTDFRRARGIHNNMIPTSTNASKAVELIMPAMRGEIYYTAVRVPVSNVSVADISFVTKKKTDVQKINTILENFSKTSKGSMLCTREPMVSVDLMGNTQSAVCDLMRTHVTDGTMCKILAWYDNEVGYAHRIKDIVCELEKFL